MDQVHLFISGKVQGVGFRNWVRSKARKMFLVGWVRNLSDGRVEAVAQGTEEELRKFVSICSRGHFFSEVASTEVIWEEPRETFIAFEKRETV